MFECFNAGFRQIQSANTSFTSDGNHVAVTVNENTITFYKDGQVLSQHPKPFNLIPNNLPIADWQQRTLQRSVPWRDR